MRVITRLVIALTLLAVCVPAAAQTTPPAKQATGSITGRVTLAGKAVMHAVVLLYRGEGIAGPAATKTSTDQDGRYRFDNLTAGQYSIRPSTPAYVAQEIPPMGKAVTVDEGEAVDDADFSLVRGGVITGRITDLNGRPIIGEQVQVLIADPANPAGNWSPVTYLPVTTDDRGIYRAFGLPSGRYAVAAGQEASRTQMVVNLGRAHYKRTYYPDAAEQVRAKVLEVNVGGEMSGVDIALGRPGKRYSATGRLVDATTGKPVANTWISHGTVTPDGKQLTGVGTAFRTDMRGNFRLESLLPGRYLTFVMGGETQGSAEPVQFEVSDKDVTGLELKLKSGITANGLVTLTGADNPAAGGLFSKVQIQAYSTAGDLSVPGVYATLKINPDGSFRLAGLTPGKLNLALIPTEANKNFSIIQVEKDGVPQNEGVIISPDDQAVNVKIALAYGSGTIRGQLKIENGELPLGAEIWAVAFPAGKSNPVRVSQADARGRFLLEGMATGEYQIELTVYLRQAGGNVQELKKVTEKVSVTSGSESQMALTINMAPGKKDDRQLLKIGDR